MRPSWMLPIRRMGTPRPLAAGSARTEVPCWLRTMTSWSATTGHAGGQGGAGRGDGTTGGEGPRLRGRRGARQPRASASQQARV